MPSYLIGVHYQDTIEEDTVWSWIMNKNHVVKGIVYEIEIYSNIMVLGWSVMGGW